MANICKRSTCSNPVGQQDRDDYRDSTFCSIQCEVKHEHIKADAKEARAREIEEAEERERYF